MKIVINRRLHGHFVIGRIMLSHYGQEAYLHVKCKNCNSEHYYFLGFFSTQYIKYKYFSNINEIHIGAATWVNVNFFYKDLPSCNEQLIKNIIL